MKLKSIFTFLFFCIVLSGLNAEEYTLKMLVDSLEDNVHYAKTEALSRMGLYNYKAARASLYPTITGSIPFKISDTEANNYPIIAVEPGIGINQLLPTAGLLSAEISDNVARSDSAVPQWTNTVGISVSLSQPVFFKGAFDAAFEIVEKTYVNSNLDVLEAKNSLAVSAIQSFYDLKQGVFNLELVQIRFNNDEENFKRINQEFEMGLWTKSDLYQAKSILIKAEIDLVEAEQTLDAARQSMISNYSFSSDYDVSGSVDLLEFEELHYDRILEEVIANSSAVNRAGNILDMQRASLAVLRKDNGPVLNLGGSYSYLFDTGTSNINQKVFSISLGLSGNLFDGGADNSEMTAEMAVLEQLESSYTGALIDLNLQTKALYDSISRYLHLRELYSLQEEASRYEFEKGLKDLELGQITEKDLSELHINLENIKLVKQQNIININMYNLQLADLQGIDLLNHPLIRNSK